MPAQTVDETFFESRIRPILVEHCHDCHSSSAGKLKGGLSVDSRDGLIQGGESGPAIMPGNPSQSLLIRAIGYEDPHLQMPPKNKRLTTRQIKDLTAWVQGGAPWPSSTITHSTPERTREPSVGEKGPAHWAFQPIRRSPPPLIPNPDWSDQPIDAFIFSKLQAAGIHPNPPATRRELIRRATLDLIGLPPTYEEIAAFESDPRPDTEAFAQVIDVLLARPEYGERWARHWLDVVRYAQSNGYERDGEKPLAWRYRDYVIKSLNEDKPYDRFVQEHLAGDELPDADADSVTATGFQRLGVWDDEPDDKRLAEFDALDDIVSTTGAAFMGITLGCARCHDHKLDPITQADYYQIVAFFRQLRPYENARFALDASNYLPLAKPQEVAQWKQSQLETIQKLQLRLAEMQGGKERTNLLAEIEKVRQSTPPFEWALGVREREGELLPTQVFVRGNPANPGREVVPRFPQILGGQQPVHFERNTDVNSSGRRLALARWLTQPDHPLTARVMVNRIWQHHFGAGIVKTSTDFGRAGIPPTHPELLDWLASDFISSGWSIKHMHRRILLSKTYRMSSLARNPDGERLNPGNELLWRQNMRRLEAESIRDSILQVSGTLNPKRGGRGFFPRLAGEVLAGASRPGLDWERSKPDELLRRSIYAYVRRTMAVPLLDGFDYSNTTSPLGERPVTTVAPQALLLLNEPFVAERAAAWCQKLDLDSQGEPKRFVQLAYQQALGRVPTPTELHVGLDFLERQSSKAVGIASRLTFRTDVPEALSTSYIDQLKPADFLLGPTSGWDYYRGSWSGAYEGIRAMERFRGPFALCKTRESSDAKLETEIILDASLEYVSLLYQTRTEVDHSQGYELILNPRTQSTMLVKQSSKRQILKEWKTPLPSSSPIRISLKRTEGTLEATLDSSTLKSPLHLEAQDPDPWRHPGRNGIRVWGAAIAVDQWKMSQPSTGTDRDSTDATVNREPRIDSATWSRNRSRELFCLMMLNLNEFVYVD